MTFIVENDSPEKIELRKAKRREKQSKIRQALLVNGYVYVKYFNIYQEAAQHYNDLNSRYPMKADLTKCDEFRAWKMAQSGAPIRIRKYNKVCHTNIPMEKCVEIPVQPVERVEIPVQPVERVEIPVQPVERVEIPVQPVERVEIPVQPVERVEIPVQPVERVEIPVQPVERVEIPVQPAERVPKKVMELKIPLLKPSVVTETLFIQTEETIQENLLEVATEGITQEETPTFHPSLMEEIPQDIIDKIIKELREDPELKTIMSNIEEDLELEQIDMEVDISDDDRLENELENLMW